MIFIYNTVIAEIASIIGFDALIFFTYSISPITTSDLSRVFPWMV